MGYYTNLIIENTGNLFRAVSDAVKQNPAIVYGISIEKIIKNESRRAFSTLNDEVDRFYDGQDHNKGYTPWSNFNPMIDSKNRRHTQIYQGGNIRRSYKLNTIRAMKKPDKNPISIGKYDKRLGEWRSPTKPTPFVKHSLALRD